MVAFTTSAMWRCNYLDLKNLQHINFLLLLFTPSSMFPDVGGGIFFWL